MTPSEGGVSVVTRVGGFVAIFVLFLLVPPAYAQFPNIRVSDSTSTYPQEVPISINPVSPLNLAAAANIDYYYYSFDGGHTWAEGQLTSTYGVWGDPCVTYDAGGNLYYAHLAFPPSHIGNWLDRIVIQKSTDGGVTWSDGTWVGLNPPKHQDKEWLSADLTSSPYRNNLYLAWTEFDNILSPAPADSSRILFSRSTDQGATWSSPVRVSEVGGLCYDDDDTVEGAVPAVGPNGEVYLSWAGHEVIYFDKSLDGGVTWGSDMVVATQPGGWNITVPGIYRCNGFPVTLCDISNSPYRGHIYIVFCDQRDGTDDTDVWFIKSTDGGTTWSSPAGVLHESGPAHQFFQWSTIDPASGYIYIVFYDRRFTFGNSTEVFVSRSQDGGATWNDFRVSASPFTTYADRFFGDYIGIAALDGDVFPIWTRMADNRDLSVWVALLNTPTSVATGPERTARFALGQNAPNPFNPDTRIEFTLDQGAEVDLTVFSVDGRPVRTLVDGMRMGPGVRTVYWDGRNESGRVVHSGIYFYQLVIDGEQQAARKMALVR
jgi:hypothetical protein